MDDLVAMVDGLIKAPSPLSELELAWEREPLPVTLSILSLCEVAPGTVWALGVPREALGARNTPCPETILFCHEKGHWRAIGKFKHRLILVLEKGEDGTIYAAGEGAFYMFDGCRWHDLEAPEVAFQRLWAPTRDEIYAIGSGEIFTFDGDRWLQVDLVRAYGSDLQSWMFGQPTLADIHGTVDGMVWVVGTWFTHSTMLTGRTLQWRRDGCPSWYLYRVRVFDNDEAIAVGGDGVVARRGSTWDWYSPAGRSAPMPRAFFPHMITRCSGTLLITGFSLLEDPPQLCVWVPDQWYRAGPKVPLEQLTQTTASIVTSSRELIVADFGATWHAQFPEPSELVTFEQDDSMSTREDSLDAIISGREGTNVGDLWDDEDTIPDGKISDLAAEQGPWNGDPQM